MESIINYFSSLDLDIGAFWKSAGILLAALLVLALLSRFIFGKKSVLCSAVSSAIGIIFLYVLTVILINAGDTFAHLISPLPFVSIAENEISLFSFHADYTLICSEILAMIILAFLMNLADHWLPTGKHLISWLFFRCVGIALAFFMHFAVTNLVTTYLPEGLIIYAPTILLAILILMLLTGALRFLVGLLLTTVNPLIAALYTFFFANLIGKQITKAVLTTAILAGLIILLQKIGIYALYITSASLAVFVPLLILLALMWYLVKKFF